MSVPLITNALEALAAGLNVLPLREDGSKAPAVEWKAYQHRRATEAEVRTLFANGRTGLGVVCGAISGGLELFEFEGRAMEAGLGDAFVEAAEAAGLGELLDRIANGYSERTPSGGRHLLYRCPSPVTAKLACGPDRLPLIETKGEGGYVITAPSHGRVHPTGRPWELITGGFATIATITDEEHAELHRLAATFDQSPRRAAAPPRPRSSPKESSRWEVLPGDDFNARATWEEILEPEGWRHLFTTGAGQEHWRRPGKDRGTSATINEHGAGTLYVFSSSTAFEPDTAYSKFGAYVVLRHEGDYKAAAKALEEAGYGQRRPGDRDRRRPGDGDGGEDVEQALEALASMAGPGPDEPGWAVLDCVADLLGRFVAFPSPACLDAVALWAVHAHAVECFESTPRLALLSPEKGSGKTRTLEVLELVVPRPRHAVNMTAAALFRAVAAGAPTLLFDEADTYFGPKVADRHEELRALVNAGHRRGAVAYRCVGEGGNMQVREFPAYAAVALAGLGDLPDTILDRSVVVRMRRRAPDETLEPFRHRKAAPRARALADRVAAWVKANADAIAAAEPAMPAGITDRPADVWEPLIALADVAGGNWPARARAAAVELNDARRKADPSLGVRLLADIRTVFDDLGVDRVSSEELVKRLCAIEEAPWGDLRGKPIDARGVAFRLRAFEVRPDTVRFEGTTRKGYLREWFYDPWKRYLPEPDAPFPPDRETSGTEGTPQVTGSSDVPDGGAVTDGNGTRPLNGTLDDVLTSTVTDVPSVPLSEQRGAR